MASMIRSFLHSNADNNNDANNEDESKQPDEERNESLDEENHIDILDHRPTYSNVDEEDNMNETEEGNMNDTIKERFSKSDESWSQTSQPPPPESEVQASPSLSLNSDDVSENVPSIQSNGSVEENQPEVVQSSNTPNSSISSHSVKVETVNENDSDDDGEEEEVVISSPVDDVLPTAEPVKVKSLNGNNDIVDNKEQEVISNPVEDHSFMAGTESGYVQVEEGNTFGTQSPPHIHRTAMFQGVTSASPNDNYHNENNMNERLCPTQGYNEPESMLSSGRQHISQRNNFDHAPTSHQQHYNTLDLPSPVEHTSDNVSHDRVKSAKEEDLPPMSSLQSNCKLLLVLLLMIVCAFGGCWFTVSFSTKYSPTRDERPQLSGMSNTFDMGNENDYQNKKKLFKPITSSAKQDTTKKTSGSTAIIEVKEKEKENNHKENKMSFSGPVKELIKEEKLEKQVENDIGPVKAKSFAEIGRDPIVSAARNQMKSISAKRDTDQTENKTVSSNAAIEEIGVKLENEKKDFYAYMKSKFSPGPEQESLVRSAPTKVKSMPGNMNKGDYTQYSKNGFDYLIQTAIECMKTIQWCLTVIIYSVIAIFGFWVVITFSRFFHHGGQDHTQRKTVKTELNVNRGWDLSNPSQLCDFLSGYTRNLNRNGRRSVSKGTGTITSKFDTSAYDCLSKSDLLLIAHGFGLSHFSMSYSKPALEQGVIRMYEKVLESFTVAQLHRVLASKGISVTHRRTEKDLVKVAVEAGF